MVYGAEYMISQGSRFLIYGAASTGSLVYKSLMNNGYAAIGFVDKRSEEIKEYYGLPVWSISEAKTMADKEDLIVFIAVKNVFEHEKIAEKLLELGFIRIIFRSNQVIEGRGTSEDIQINEIYDRLLDPIQTIRTTILCPSVKMADTYTLTDQAIICDAGGYVTANIPVQYVFTDHPLHCNNMWNDIPCLGLLPHLGLFNMFLGKGVDDFGLYMEFCKNAAKQIDGMVLSKAWEASVYKNRLDVFNHLQYSWEFDRDFFIRNAVEGIYSEKGYFNIMSGKHRITYLLAKGCSYIPLKIKKEDYKKWRKKEVAKQIYQFFKDHTIDTTPIRLPNPYLYRYPCSSSSFYENVLRRIILTIFRFEYRENESFDFRNKRILFYRTPLAIFAEIFASLGFEIFIYEDQQEVLEFDRIVLSDVKCCNFFNIPEAIFQQKYYLAIAEDAVDANAELTVTISNVINKKKNMLACGLVGTEMKYSYCDISSRFEHTEIS